ncbi:hypothetical protein V6N13_119591 [Hibiscus sabdariffa]
MASALAGDDLSARSISSGRSWGSSRFRDIWQTPPEVFERSQRHDTEEDLMWAAIERLPMYDRLRKSMIRKVGDNGKVALHQVDVTKLGPHHKKQLVDSILKVVDEDNEKFLRKLRDRTDRVGIEIPKIEVRFEHLSVEGDVYVGSRALPTLLNATLNVVESILGLVRLLPSKKRKMSVELSNHQGKTTLLQALAGKLDHDLRSRGRITYCGYEMSEFIPQRTCAYIGPHDVHHGEMTVRETLDFSGRCLGVGTRYEMLKELSKREKEAGIKPDPEIDAFMKATAMPGQQTSLVTDYVLKILGLEICSDTLVGDEMRRGISGGEKKRLTTGEMLIPLSFMESGIWICLTYYTIGFAPAAGRFFRQFLAFIGVHQMALSLFRFIAAVGRTQVIANTLGTFTLLMIFILGGFIVAKDDIDPWMIWGYYLSPMMYGQNAIVMNEFLDKRWNTKINDSRYHATTVGQLLLKTLTYLNPLRDSKAIVVDEDKNKNKKESSSGENIEGIDLPVRNCLDTADITDQPSRRGMVLPFKPLSLAFNHVSYSVDMPSEMKSQAWLRLSSEVDTKKRKMFIEEVMELVELTALRDALVGLPGVDGLSTEQRKRAAAIVMRTVRNTVDTGRTVVCTIHQPSIDIFESFDELLLMKRGGQLIYAGPLGRNSHHLVEYFEAIPGVPKIKEGYNPATWMLEISFPAFENQLNVDFAEIYAKSSLYQRNQELIKELSTPTPGSQDLFFPTKYSLPFLSQCKVCFLKQHWSYMRNPPYNAIRFFITIFVGILFGLIYWNKGQQIAKQQDVLNFFGAMYCAVYFLGAVNTASVQGVVAIERTVFYRERAAGMYSALPYAFAQVAIEIIYTAIQTLHISVGV